MTQPKSLRRVSKNVRKVMSRVGNARQVIGSLEKDVQITGLTSGQFSAIDVLEHMADELGPGCDVRVSTWTTGLYDVHRAAKIKDGGRINDIKMLVDRGTFETSPKFAAPLIEALGVDSFRCLSVHAKVIIVIGPAGAAVFRSSMNLNKNLRTEQFDIDVCDDVVDFYVDWFDALWEESGQSQNNRKIISAVYDRRCTVAEDDDEVSFDPVDFPFDPVEFPL